MAQGTRRNRRPQLLEDLDAMIVSRALRPEKVKLGGRLWTIKRDFTAEQILQFHALTNRGKALEAFTMLVGAKDAPEFAELVLSAPTELMTPALRRLYTLAGLLKRDDFDKKPADDQDDEDGEGDQDGEDDQGGEGGADAGESSAS